MKAGGGGGGLGLSSTARRPCAPPGAAARFIAECVEVLTLLASRESGEEGGETARRLSFAGVELPWRS